MKYFGSLTFDMNSWGCLSSAECSAEVPALGAPITKKSGWLTRTSLAIRGRNVNQFHRITRFLVTGACLRRMAPGCAR
jgi:hypothetical protein